MNSPLNARVIGATSKTGMPVVEQAPCSEAKRS